MGSIISFGNNINQKPKQIKDIVYEVCAVDPEYADQCAELWFDIADVNKNGQIDIYGFQNLFNDYDLANSLWTTIKKANDAVLMKDEFKKWFVIKISEQGAFLNREQDGMTNENIVEFENMQYQVKDCNDHQKIKQYWLDQKAKDDESGQEKLNDETNQL